MLRPREAGLSDRRHRLAQGGRGDRPPAGAVRSEESVEQLSAGGDEPVDVVAACNALGLFGGRRLVLVRNAEELDEDAVAAIVDVPPDACARDRARASSAAAGIGPKHPLVQAVEPVGDVRVFDAPERKQAADWVVRRFAESRTSRARPPSPAGWSSSSARTSATSRSRSRSWSPTAGGEAPEVEDVERLVIPQHRHQAVGHHRRLGPARRRRRDRLATADIERPEDVGRVIAQLSAHVRRVHRAAVMVEARRRPRPTSPGSSV